MCSGDSNDVIIDWEAINELLFPLGLIKVSTAAIGAQDSTQTFLDYLNKYSISCDDRISRGKFATIVCCVTEAILEFFPELSLFASFNPYLPTENL